MFFNLWQLNYRAQYEKTKTNYTLPQDIPQLVKAKANAELYSEVSQVTWKYLYSQCHQKREMNVKMMAPFLETLMFISCLQ